MNSAVNFIIESGVSLAVLSLIYIFFLRKETFFRLNRIFLLISVAFSVLLPFLKLRVYEPQTNMLAEVTVTPQRNLLESVTIYGQDFSGAVERSINSSRLIIIIYLIGLIIFSIRFILKLIQIIRLIKNSEVEESGLVKFVFLKKDFSPFSFLSYVFVNPEMKQNPGYEKMVRHELEHIRQGHSFDVLILEVLTIFQWFNPFMWLLKRVIRENHEFLADRAVLDSGMSRVHYKQLLLSQAVGFNINMSNSFNASLTKNRIKMISRIQSSKLANWKYLPGVASVVILVVIFACEHKQVAYAAKNDSVEIATVEKQDKVHLEVEDNRMKLVGDKLDIEKISQNFSDKDQFKFETDNDGNIYLARVKPVKFETVEEVEPVKIEVAEEEVVAVASKVSEVKSLTPEIKKNPSAKATKDKLSEDKTVYYIVEDMPEFPGGDLALRKFIAQSIKYPVVAQENGIQGKVYVTFVVSKTGEVKDVRIVRGIDPSLDKEALRVVSSLPKWKPGTQREKAVNVSYTVPISFVLQ